MKTITFRNLLLIAMLAIVVQSRGFAQSTATTRPAATQPLQLPTMADLNEMHDAGQYRTCLQQIARLLFLRGEAAKHYDRFALFLMRGDCLLHLEDPETALEAYQQAMKSPDPKQAAEARATALLIQSSARLEFTPKFPPGAPSLNIVDHAKRKAAMLALMEQKRFDAKSMIDAALTATTLVPIINATPTLIDLHALELTGSGSDAQIHPTLVSIGERARDLMSQELTAVDQRISLIEKVSGQSVGTAIGGYWWGAAARLGLTTSNRDALRHDAAYADQITAAAVQFQHISRSLGGTGNKWEPIIEQGTQVAQHARDVLMTE